MEDLFSQGGDLRNLRFGTVRSHVQVAWTPPTETNFGPMFVECFEKLTAQRNQLWDKRIPEMVQAYFEDLRLVLYKLRTVSRDDAVVWLAVSTSAYAGIEIPTDEILAFIAEQVGWNTRGVFLLRRLRSSGQHQNELASSGKMKSDPHRERFTRPRCEFTSRDTRPFRGRGRGAYAGPVTAERRRRTASVGLPRWGCAQRVQEWNVPKCHKMSHPGTTGGAGPRLRGGTLTRRYAASLSQGARGTRKQEKDN